MWTSPAQVAFMAITAHYIAPGRTRPVQRSALVAFRKISGSHSGRNMARCMAEVLRDLRITHKVYSHAYFDGLAAHLVDRLVR